MPSKSKNKGNKWEREVATFLTATYNESFIRVPSSGAFVGGKNASRKNTLDEGQIQSKKGDIHPPSTWNHLNIECKSYADFPFHHLLVGDVKILDTWITQTLDASNLNDFNLIMIKINRKGKWVAFEKDAPFTIDHFIKYKEWIFCSWEEFWLKSSNVDKVKHYSTNGVCFE